jgi:uncharacterized membrane protein
MTTVRVEKTIARPRAEVFAYVDDWHHATDYVEGMVGWEPQSEVTHGVGARFKATIDLKVRKLDSSLEFTDWRQDELLEWKPTGGFRQSGRWEFTDTADGGGTDVVFITELEFPGGLAGKALARAIGPAIKANLNKTVDNLKHKLED